MIIAMVIWLAVKAGGGDEFFHRPAQIHGAARAWKWLAGMTSVTGGCSTLALNNSDWSRFSKKPSSQFWPFLALPLFLTTVGLCGIVGASASEKIWGTALWNPLDIVSINLSTNSVAFATDIGTLAPKWLNIRRASFLGFLIGGWALCPWIILKSAQTFLSFMAAYSMFMAPITGILLTDFYLIKKQKYDVPALYDPKGIYYYQYGCNWRALVVLLIIIVPLLPPMAHVVNPSSISVPAGFTHLYDFNWLYGFISGSTLYYLLNRIFPYKRGLIPTAVLVESSIHGNSAIEGVATQHHADVENKASDPYGDEKLQSEVAEAFAGVTPRPGEG
ncbi:hypothetical protein LTR47_007803 [Exophiala xenobiotica]|nr:hypothetical protein LTR47_007803 [Exophiala xenobiotica]KAK5243654.1 hypothetical protein LTS06_010627 [Exophiala xenobiotica]KAK5282290.1 hypothetical protein LTR40_003533 [Exophiala xenobiotica]KAK5348335.1 hypothetical protein LTR61_007794 [Exophiala xenobiotica]KAK5367445.1 hypothetical protein LTS03_008487 [Exophiala xenobiotica]